MALQDNGPGSDVSENGNGSLMMILPLAFVKCTDEEIARVSAITHAHLISKQACIIYVHIAKRLLDGDGLQNIIPSLQYEKPFDRLSRINQLSESEIHSSGYVIDTLEAALWLLSFQNNAEQKSYKADVLRAVNLGDDTDTTGAVTGGLAGILYEIGSDEERWLKTLRNKKLIEECLWQ